MTASLGERNNASVTAPDIGSSDYDYGALTLPIKNTSASIMAPSSAHLYISFSC